MYICMYIYIMLLEPLVNPLTFTNLLSSQVAVLRLYRSFGIPMLVLGGGGYSIAVAS